MAAAVSENPELRTGIELRFVPDQSTLFIFSRRYASVIPGHAQSIRDLAPDLTCAFEAPPGESIHPLARIERQPSTPAFQQEKPLKLREYYGILVECADESEQRRAYERLVADGIRCRLLTL